MKFGNPIANVGISGAVPVKGFIAAQTVASGATSNVVNVATNTGSVPLTTTVIPASVHIIELHDLVFVTEVTTNGTARLIRSDTGVDLVIPQSFNVTGKSTITKDFQGAQIPAGVAVQSVATTAGGGTGCTVSVDINYNLIG